MHKKAKNCPLQKEKPKAQLHSETIEQDFDVKPMFKLAQRGLPTPYRQCDFFAVTEPSENISQGFLDRVKSKYFEWNKC